MGRPELSKGKKKSKQVTLKMNFSEARQLAALAALSHSNLLRLLDGHHVSRRSFRRTGKRELTPVLRTLIHSAYSRLQEGGRPKRAATPSPSSNTGAGTGAASTGKSLRTIDASEQLDLDPAQFLDLAKRAGVIPKRERSGHVYWSQADVDDVENYMERTGSGPSRAGPEISYP